MTLRDEIMELAAAHKARKMAAHSNPSPISKRVRNEQIKRSTCDSKESYTYPMAKLVVERIRRNHHSPVEAYHCKWCGFWHVGRPLEKKREHQTD
jgi:hypothetical protein